MTEQASVLTAFYGGWERYQRALVGVIAPLSPDQLALRATPNQWPAGMIAQHIVANRVWWFHGWMGEGDADLFPIAHWDPQYDAFQPLRPSAELIAALETTWGMIDAALARWTLADLSHVFPPASFLSEDEQRMIGERIRQWIIWHVFEHEIHHGGELSLTLGIHGLPGIYGDM